MNPENQTAPTITTPSPPPPAVTPAAAAQPVNYEAFDNMPHTSKRWLPLSAPPILAFIALCVVAVLQAGSYQGPSDSKGGGGWVVWLSILGFVMCVASIGLYAWRQSVRQKAAFAQFVLENGWSLSDESIDDTVATSLLGIGRDPRASQGFTGQYHGRTLHGVVYQYTTGSGKSQEVHTYANLYFELNQEFPLIVLDNKGNNLLGLFSTLPDRIQGGIPLHLEGNFNDTFRVIVLPGTEQEVLQFLTPDFMSELLMAPKQTDIEIEANKLFVIMSINSGNFNVDFTGPTLNQLFMTADIVLKQLGEVAFSWQASSSPDSVAQMAATALAPRSSAMLGKRHVGVGSAVSIVVYALLNAGPSFGAKGMTVAIPVLLGIGAVSLYIYWERHR